MTVRRKTTKKNWINAISAFCFMVFLKISDGCYSHFVDLFHLLRQ